MPKIISREKWFLIKVFLFVVFILGKSTIAKLLMRLYDPTSGSITFDGHDLRSLDITPLHQQMAIVSQSPSLLGNVALEYLVF